MKAHLSMKSLTKSSLLILGFSSTTYADIGSNAHQFELKARTIYFDRKFDNSSRNREQSAQSVILNYKSPQLGGVVGVHIAGYYLADLDHDGSNTEDILTKESDGELAGFGQFGEAYINITPTDDISIKLGRQRHNSVLLRSSVARALPNTYQGGSIYVDSGRFQFYGAVYDEWSRRARDTFESFATDRSEEGAIDYVGVLGLSYQTENLKVELEHLSVDEFLSKFGLRATYTVVLEASKLSITGGLFTSSDNGNLFVTASESGDLDDEDASGSVAGETKSENNGLGGFVDLAWKKSAGEISFAYAKVDEIWLEDNFAGYHGPNPFPTRSRVGPDLTNTGEDAVRLKYKHDWKKIVPGLTTAVSVGYGWNAENSEDSSLGTADENWRELEVRYKIPQIESLQLRGIWHQYKSDESGSVDGVKPYQEDIRFYVDYTYKF